MYLLEPIRYRSPQTRQLKYATSLPHSHLKLEQLAQLINSLMNVNSSLMEDRCARGADLIARMARVHLYVEKLGESS